MNHNGLLRSFFAPIVNEVFGGDIHMYVGPCRHITVWGLDSAGNLSLPTHVYAALEPRYNCTEPASRLGRAGMIDARAIHELGPTQLTYHVYRSTLTPR